MRALIEVSLLGVALGGVACSRAASAPLVPPSPTAVAPVSRAMFGASAGETTGEDAFERLFDAPEVTAAGERVLDRLGNEPTLQPRYSEFLAKLMAHPTMVAALVAVAEATPGASIDSVSEQVAARVGEAIDGPAFDAALDGSIDRLFERPAVEQAFERMAEAIFERGHFTDKLAELLAQWQPDLEAAVGLPMSDERFAARLEQHLASPARARALRVLLDEQLVEDPTLRTALTRVIDDDAFFAASAALVEELLTSEELQTHVTELFAGFIERVDDAELGLRVDRVLVTTTTEQAVVRWVDRIMASPAFDALAVQVGLRLDDPVVQAQLHEALVGPPHGSTA